MDDSEKGEVIKKIHEAGRTMLHTVFADNLAEAQALKLEAELIFAFGIGKHGGLLANMVRPNPNTISKGRDRHPMSGSKGRAVGS